MERERESREGLSPESVKALKAFVHISKNIYNTIITFASQYKNGAQTLLYIFLSVPMTC